MKIKTIMIIGAGQMGRGIALTAAIAGLDVVLYDLNDNLLSDSLAKISALDKGAVSERIQTSTSIEDAALADLIIEAVSEDMAVKGEIFSRLSSLARTGVILASNTSSISISKLAACTSRPQHVIGMHFMNPVHKMALVEVVRGLLTCDETVDIVKTLARTLGKEPVLVEDFPGFVSNRLLMPMLNEAIFCVQDGVADPAAIDQIMRLGMHHPMGPLALADLIGLDTCLAIMRVLHDNFADSKYRPCPLLVKMVAAGRLGKKSGWGFYEY